MNPIILILAVLFLIPIIKEIRIFILIKYYSEKVIGQVDNIESKEMYSGNLNKILQGGNNKILSISYVFLFKNKEYKVINDELLISPSSKFNKLNKNDNIIIYVYSNNNEIKDTWLFKPKFTKLIPYIILFLLLLMVAYLSKDI